MSIYKKLFEAKKEIGKISKDSKNPFFKSKYFDINKLLEHVEPILQKHDLLLIQPIVNNHQQTVVIDIETGEKEISEIQLSDIKDPQKKGSEITYFRRYTAQCLLGLQAEDDDANLAAKSKTPPTTIDVSPNSIERLKARLDACSTLEMLGSTYKSFTTKEQAAMASYTKELKQKLSTLKTA